LLIEGDLAARRELDREQVLLGGVLVAGLAAGVALGHPVAASALALAVGLAWRFAGFAGVFAVCLGALALGSSSIEEVKSAGTDVRWVALGTLAAWPAVSGRRLQVLVPRLLFGSDALLVAVAFASTAWSIDPGLTARRAAAFAVMVFVALVVVPIHAATRPERRSLVVSLGTLCATGALAAVVTALVSPSLARSTPTAFAAFNGLPSLPSFGPLRAWFESPQTIGIWCAILLPFVIALSPRRVAIPLTMATIGVALWSYSRGALVLLVIALVWYAWTIRPRRTVLAGAALAGVVLVAALGGTLVTNTALTKFNRAGGGERSLFGGRLEAWDATMDLVGAAPASGYGFGTGDRLFKRSRADQRFIYFNGSNAADGYLQALVEVGPLGLLAILGVFAGGIGAAVRRRPRARGPFLLVGIGFAAIGVTESVFTSPGSPFTLLMWSCLALAATPILAARRDDARRDEEDDLVPLGRPALAVTAGRLHEEGVVAANGRHDRVPLGTGGRNRNGHRGGLEVGEERVPQDRVPGDRPA
jgi:exopolysaccharide production protein ExoQ